jgi:hypothetical protein
MSVLTTRCLVRAGKHASAADFLTEPASYVQAGGGAHLLLESNPFASPERLKFRRGPDHPQNVGFQPFFGPIDVSKEYVCPIVLRGLSENTGGAIDPATTTDATPFLDCSFGTDSIDPAGAATTSTGGGSNTKTVGVTEQARFPVGTVIGVTTDQGLEVVQVRARAGSSGAGNLTVDRNVVGAVTNLATVLRFARWKDDPNVFEHTHLGLDVEWPGVTGTSAERRLFLGGMGKWKIKLKGGRYATLELGLKFTKISAETPTATAYVAPTAGSALVRANNKVWINDESFIALEGEIEEGGECVARDADDGPSNIYGFTKNKGGDGARTKLNIKFYRGASTGEVPESTGTFTARVAQGLSANVGDPMSTFNVGIQVGGAAGALGFGIMHSAALTRCEEIVIGGKRGFDCDFEAFGAVTDLAPFEWHMG